MNSEGSRRIILSVLVFAGVAFAFIAYQALSQGPGADGQVVKEKAEGGEARELVSTGSTEPGDVLVELEPSVIKNGKLSFKFYANTHSVDLSQFNLMDITTLAVNGKIIKPSAAPRMRGHHVSGVLVFDGVEEAFPFTVTIRGIPKTDERVFEWR